MQKLKTPKATDPSIGSSATLSDFTTPSHLCWQPHGQALPMRRWQRVRYHHSVLLTPFDETFEKQVGASIVVDGRDISVGGFSFRHLEPLAERFVVVTFPMETTDQVYRAMRLSWCRFLQRGIYESGGKFLHNVNVDGFFSSNTISPKQHGFP